MVAVAHVSEAELFGCEGCAVKFLIVEWQVYSQSVLGPRLSAKALKTPSGMLVRVLKWVLLKQGVSTFDSRVLGMARRGKCAVVLLGVVRVLKFKVAVLANACVLVCGCTQVHRCSSRSSCAPSARCACKIQILALVRVQS